MSATHNVCVACIFFATDQAALVITLLAVVLAGGYAKFLFWSVLLAVTLNPQKRNPQGLYPTLQLLKPLGYRRQNARKPS